MIEEIVFALPKEKKVTFVNNVKRENVSATSQATANKGFVETVWEFITEDVPTVAQEIVDSIADWIGQKVKGFFSWF